MLENETDGYHPGFVHGSIFQVTDSGIANLYGSDSTALTRDYGNGHTEFDLRPEWRRRQPADARRHGRGASRPGQVGPSGDPTGNGSGPGTTGLSQTQEVRLGSVAASRFASTPVAITDIISLLRFLP